MKDRGAWLALLALVIIVVVLVFAGHAGSPASAPDHRSTSDAANGTSALRLYAQALGHRIDTMEAAFAIPQDAGLVFVFRPSARPFTGDDANVLLRWVEAGGILVYASEEADVSLEGAFNLARQRAPAPAEADAAAPVFAGVRHLSGGVLAFPFTLHPQQVAVLRNGGHAAVGLLATVGQGRIVALADPIPLCNGYLERADNGRFAADLLALSTG